MLKELGAKLRGIVICLLTWACFFSAIIAPRCVGIPATLNVFGVYELPTTIPLVLVWKYGIINFEIVVLTFLYVGLPIVMGVVFFYFSCICLFAPKIRLVPVPKEEVEKMKENLEQLEKRKLTTV